MNRLLSLVLLLITTTLTYAQSNALEGELMFLNRHAWRGEIFGTSVAVEPSATATAGHFSFNVWAALTLDNSYSELDLIPSYQFRFFKLSLLDYYNPVAGKSNNFWSVKKEFSRHSVEITLDNFDVEKHRFKWLAGTFILGDRDEDSGRPLYSTYVELSYSFNLWELETTPFAGFTPWTGYYAPDFAFVNTGLTLSHELDINSFFTIPLTLSAVYNPSTQNSFVTFGTGIAF